MDTSAAAGVGHGGGEAIAGGEAIGDTLSVEGGEAKFHRSGIML